MKLQLAPLTSSFMVLIELLDPCSDDSSCTSRRQRKRQSNMKSWRADVRLMQLIDLDQSGNYAEGSVMK